MLTAIKNETYYKKPENRRELVSCGGSFTKRKGIKREKKEIENKRGGERKREKENKERRERERDRDGSGMV